MINWIRHPSQDASHSKISTHHSLTSTWMRTMTNSVRCRRLLAEIFHPTAAFLCIWEWQSIPKHWRGAWMPFLPSLQAARISITALHLAEQRSHKSHLLSTRRLNRISKLRRRTSKSCCSWWEQVEWSNLASQPECQKEDKNLSRGLSIREQKRWLKPLTPY